MAKTYFWEESPGNQSANRLIFIIGSFWAMALTTVLAIKFKKEVVDLIALFSALEGLLIGLKVGQKAMENKNGKPIDNTDISTTQSTTN